MDADTYFSLFDLKPNQLSKVDNFTLPTGEKAFRLLKLTTISKPHKANLKEDYHKIATFAKESKKWSISTIGYKKEKKKYIYT